MKQNNAEFTNVSSFTSLCTCNTHNTLSCRILLFSLPTSNNFFKFVYSENPGQSAWWVLFRPRRCCLFLWRLKVIRTDLLRFWTSDIQDLPTSYSKFLYFTVLFVSSVLYTTNALKSAQFSRYSTTFFDHFTVFLRTE